MDHEVICCCHNVTIKDVKGHIEKGISTFEELQSITNIGKDCPPCEQKNRQLFNQLLNQ